MIIIMILLIIIIIIIIMIIVRMSNPSLSHKSIVGLSQLYVLCAGLVVASKRENVNIKKSQQVLWFTVCNDLQLQWRLKPDEPLGHTFYKGMVERVLCYKSLR